MSEIDSQEIIEDLKDQIHDLEQDLREAAIEKERLESELAEQYDKTTSDELDKDGRIKELEEAATCRFEENTRLQKRISDLEQHKDKHTFKYTKALSIAETLRENMSLDYFQTSEGRKLLDWAVGELRIEMSKIMKEEN